MRSILTSRLGRISTIAAIAGLAIVAGGVGAEARWNGYYYDGWGYRQYYSAPAPSYYYGYAPGYRYYSPPAYAYSAPYYGPSYYGPAYYGPSFSLSIPLR